MVPAVVSVSNEEASITEDEAAEEVSVFPDSEETDGDNKSESVDSEEIESTADVSAYR